MSNIYEKRMKELVQQLNEASKAYYAENREIISNFEYDKLYDELVQLEEESGVTFSQSPTLKVGYEALSQLPKEKHEKQMLSLGKTKSREELKDWLKGKPAILSWKLDGLTIVLTYENGELIKAVTRGNGEVGEVITNNARVFSNLPLKIKHKGTVILRGEAIITYSDFKKINEKIQDTDAKYKNPRNLCSGSVRQLNNEITAQRTVKFYAFTLVKADDYDFGNSREQQMIFMKSQGFDVVDYKIVNDENILEVIEDFEQKIEHNDIPSDGLVLSYNDMEYGQSLGNTAKFPRDSIAFKWQDEVAETTLKEIEWSPSRTGLINPVAIFEPVELEGTTVSRASVHNVSIVKTMKLGIGDKITVYKANMIIPQIAENLTQSGTIEVPDSCPVCGGKTEIKQSGEVQSLYCINEKCQVKKIKSFTLFVSRDALNVDGLSEATLEKLISKTFIHEYADIFHLDRYKDQIVEMEGFGDKSYTNLIKSVEKSKNTTLAKVIYALGIPNVGLAGGKLLCKEYKNDFTKLLEAKQEELSQIAGIGDVIAASFVDYFLDEENLRQVKNLMQELIFTEEIVDESALTLSGMNFVITGSLEQFESRNDLKDLIEKKGGKVTASVTSKTTCLINNDVTSNSSKNKSAKDLDIPIISEQDFMERYMN